MNLKLFCAILIAVHFAGGCSSEKRGSGLGPAQVRAKSYVRQLGKDPSRAGAILSSDDREFMTIKTRKQQLPLHYQRLHSEFPMKSFAY